MMEWVNLVGTAQAADTFGVMPYVNSFVLLIRLVVGALLIGIVSWRALQVSTGRLEIVFEVLGAAAVGIAVYLAAPTLVQAGVGGAVGMPLLSDVAPYLSTAVGDGIGWGLAVGGQGVLGMRLWFAMQGRSNG